MPLTLFERLFTIRRPETPEALEPGLRHFVLERNGAVHRLHLRVEPDGSGLLVANARAALRLRPTGVVIALGLLEARAERAILGDLAARYRDMTAADMEHDLALVKLRLDALLDPAGQFPIFNLEDAALSPYETTLIAPLEATMPLAPPAQTGPLLERLWDAGIPHVTLAVPAGPDPDHLLRAVERAEQLGLICGVSGRATDLAPSGPATGGDGLLERLIAAGLDHLTAFFAAADPAAHDALFGAGDHARAAELFRQTEALDLADVARIPLLPGTIDGLEATLATLHGLAVPNVRFFAIASETENDAVLAPAMRQVAAFVEEAADAARVAYIWEPPVQRDPALSLSAQVAHGPRCAGDVAMRVEPDGAVIPPRGPYRAAGNLLTDDWAAIWRHPSFRAFRERVESPTRCHLCPGLAICAADCPVEPRGWAQ